MSRRRPLGRERGLQRKGRRPVLPGHLPSTSCLQFLQGAAQDDACSAPQGERLGQEERGQRRFLRWRRSPSSLSRLPQRFSSPKVQVRIPGSGRQRRPLLNGGGFVCQVQLSCRKDPTFVFPVLSDSTCFLFSVPQVMQMKEDLEKVRHADGSEATTAHLRRVQNKSKRTILV